MEWNGGMEYGMERQTVKTNQEARQEEIKEQGTLAQLEYNSAHKEKCR